MVINGFRRALLDFTDPLNDMLEDEQTMKTLFERYPKQHLMMMKKYKDVEISAYYLCLIHLAYVYKCDQFIVAGEILSIRPEYKAG